MRHDLSQADKEISFPLLRFGLTWQPTLRNLLWRQLTKQTRIASSAAQIATQCQALFTSAGAIVLYDFSFFFLPLEKKTRAAAGKNVTDYDRSIN